MSIIMPFVHIFNTPEKYYVYDVNKNTILRITENVYNALNKSLIHKQDFNIDELLDQQEKDSIKFLINEGFFSNTRVKEIIHPENEMLEYYLESKLSMITLQVTQQCNLKCNYCPYSGSYINRRHSNKRMKLETAMKGIDFLIDHSRNSKTINIGFYGGEPLIEFNLIKICMEYATIKAEGKELSFSITTNATLVDENIIDTLIKYNVQLLISLDGPKNVHDKNRKMAANNCGSFDKVTQTMELIKDRCPEFYKNNVRFNAVLDTSDDFSCTKDFFTNYELVKESNLRSSEVSTGYRKEGISYSENYTSKVYYEIFKLFLSKLNRLKKENTSRLVDGYYNNIARINSLIKPQKSLPAQAHHAGPCIPGAVRLFLNVDGNFYPCEKVSETSSVMRIGNVDTGFDIEKARRLLNIGKLTEDSCKNCWAIRFCTLCAMAADNIDDLSAELKQSNCGRVRRNVEERFKDYCLLSEFDKKIHNEAISIL